MSRHRSPSGDYRCFTRVLVSGHQSYRAFHLDSGRLGEDFLDGRKGEGGVEVWAVEGHPCLKSVLTVRSGVTIYCLVQPEYGIDGKGSGKEGLKKTRIIKIPSSSRS